MRGSGNYSGNEAKETARCGVMILLTYGHVQDLHILQV